MAQVTISVGGISVGIEDEDATAKRLKSLALDTVKDLIELVGVEVLDDDEEEADG